MPIYSFHLANSSLAITMSALRRPPHRRGSPGLHHAECMTVMKLGSPILSTSRMQLNRLAVFARWDREDAIDKFLAESRLGRTLGSGWHVRMEFLRRWGQVAEFGDLPEDTGTSDPDAPVVAVTLARMRLSEVPRFIRWGKPVEAQVRDHPGTTLALAAIRLPRTVSTFTIWRAQRDMTSMVHGRDRIPGAERHTSAMQERDRKDFHHEFTTLRFRAISEYGEWQGRRGIIPIAPESA